jgi:hypothetical protein
MGGQGYVDVKIGWKTPKTASKSAENRAKTVKIQNLVIFDINAHFTDLSVR